MLCAQIGMEPTEREDHAAYVASWLRALRDDKRAIFRAATAAQAASELILSHMAALAMSRAARSEEHTSELQSLMRISYAVFCLKKKINTQRQPQHTSQTTIITST